jgi:hypothetical protein
VDAVICNICIRIHKMHISLLDIRIMFLLTAFTRLLQLLNVVSIPYLYIRLWPFGHILVFLAFMGLY